MWLTQQGSLMRHARRARQCWSTTLNVFLKDTTFNLSLASASGLHRVGVRVNNHKRRTVSTGGGGGIGTGPGPGIGTAGAAVVVGQGGPCLTQLPVCRCGVREFIVYVWGWGWGGQIEHANMAAIAFLFSHRAPY